MTQNTAAGEWKTGSQIQLEQNGKRWSRKAVKTIWQIRYALQCGTELLIWELGLLNLSFHYSNRNPKDICSLQFSSQWARSVVLTVKSRFIFHFKTRKCYRTVLYCKACVQLETLQCHPMDTQEIICIWITYHDFIKASGTQNISF